MSKRTEGDPKFIVALLIYAIVFGGLVAYVVWSFFQ